MGRRKKFSFLWIVIPMIAVGIFLFLSAHYLIDPDLYRNVIQKSLTLNLGREVIIGKAKISLWGGIGIAFEDFRVKDRSLAFDLLQSKRLIVIAKILPLFKKEIKWRRIVLERPTFHLLRDKNGRFNFFDAPLTKDELRISQKKMIQTLSTLFGGSLTIRDGVLSFSDESLGDSPLLTEIQSFSLRLSKVSHSKPFPFRASGKIIHSKKEGKFSMSGTIENIPEDMDLSKGKVKAQVEIKGIETFHFWPYLKTLLPMKTISGTLDLNAHFQGDLSGFLKTSAKIKFRDLVYDHPKVFAFTLNPKWVNLDFDANYDTKDFKVSQFSIELPEIKVNGKGKVYGIGTQEMGLEAEAASSTFDLSDGKKYIPYGIITPKVSDSLFRAEGKGPVQIISARLSGKIPEIEHCDQLQYAHTLSVEMKVNGARLKFPWNLPVLEDLKGHLLFKEGHLNLKEVEGRVFHSSIDRANGIFEQLLHIPTLQIHCEGRFDLADLPSLAKIEGFSSDFSQSISPIISLSGRAQYRLFLKGKLKPPFQFQHQGVYQLSKVRFSHSQIPFPILIGEGRMEFSNEGLQWSGAKVEFVNSSLLMNGSWKKEEKSAPFKITARGRVDFKSLFSLSQSSLFPEEIRLKTSGIQSLMGTGQFSFKGGRQTDHGPFSYEVELMPKDLSLLPKGVSISLTFRDGSLSFSNLGATFSKVRIQSRNSLLTLDGSMIQGNLNLSTSGSIDLKTFHSILQSPLFPDQVRGQMEEVQELVGGAEVRLKWIGRMEDWTAALRDGEIRLKGISFQHRKIPVPLSHIEGSILFSAEQIRCEGLKGKLGDSPLMISSVFSRLPPSPRAGVSDGPAGLGRQVSFQISSSHLNLDSIFPKSEKPTPTSFEKVRDWLLNWSINGKLDVDQGKYRSLHYRDLKIEMKTSDGKLMLSPFQFKADGGDFWGEGWIQPIERGIRFEIKPRISNMEAKAFLRTLLQKEEEEKIVITGRVHIDKVNLRGEGEDFQKVKESLNGMLRLELENGIIERGNILAKIFSILNVSQLFKGRLPDLKTKGLPYHQIMAHIHVKDGVASTEDLVVDSDAMKITILGKVDLGKNRIDARIGIHPLVTLDTVLSNVPIVGYILTGKDKAFLSYVYEVEGDLNDPKVEAIPIKSMGESLWGIIKRLIETPLRPFQKGPSPDKEKK